MVWQPSGFCLFSKGVQLGLSVTSYPTSLHGHTLARRALMVMLMFPAYNKVNGFYPAENELNFHLNLL